MLMMKVDYLSNIHLIQLKKECYLLESSKNRQIISKDLWLELIHHLLKNIKLQILKSDKHLQINK
jgi:hypothetical protein